MPSLIDTRVLIRFLVKDNPEQFRQAQTWLEEGESGKRELILSPVVVAEVCFVLESFYKKNRAEIANAMEVLLSQRWLKVISRNELVLLWPLYRKGLHFVDSFIITSSSVAKADILTFDKAMQKEIK